MKSNKFPPKKNVAQAMVEFAIVLPVLLLLLYGLLEAGRLLFMYSSIVTASRQASRYGSATGLGLTNAVPRYQDCAGIKAAAQKADYLNAFDDDDITIEYDNGEGVAIDPLVSDDECLGDTDDGIHPSSDNTTRIVVTVTGQFYALVKLVPFPDRPITATSSRTILLSVPIEVDTSGSIATPEPTLISMTQDINPSGIGQLVTVEVTVTDGASGTPDGKVTFFFKGAPIAGCEDLPRDAVTDTFICKIRFYEVGVDMPLKAVFTPTDSALNDPADIEQGHTVTEAAISITVEDNPSLSIPGASVSMIARVRSIYDDAGTYIMPTGTVTFTNDEGVSCTDDLDTNGYASCGLVFTVDGNYEAVYTSTDGFHVSGGSATGDHQVSVYTATASRTPEPTATATSTPVPTATLAATAIPTRVTGCNSIKDYFDALPKKPSPLIISSTGYTMTLLIPNPNLYQVEFNEIFVAWNGSSGHRVKPGVTEELRLMSVALNGTLWQMASPGQGGSSYTVQAPFLVPAVIEPNSSATLTFTFDKTYNNPKDEVVTLQFATPGCETFTFTVTR